MRQFWSAFCAGLWAWCIGKALGVPVWRDGWDIGDRTDLAVLAFFAVWLAFASDSRSKPDRAATGNTDAVHESDGAARQSP